MFYAVDIASAILVVVLIAVGGAGRAIHAGWAIRSTELVSQRIVTQRWRYANIWVAQSVIVASVAWLLSQASITEVYATTLEFASISFFGKVIAAGMVLVVVSPIISIAATISVYRRPATCAYRSGQGYTHTDDVRSGMPRSERYIYAPNTVMIHGEPVRLYNLWG